MEIPRGDSVGNVASAGIGKPRQSVVSMFAYVPMCRSNALSAPTRIVKLWRSRRAGQWQAELFRRDRKQIGDARKRQCKFDFCGLLRVPTDVEEQ